MIKKLKRGLLLEGLLKGTCLLNGACLLKGACVLTGACLLKGVVYYEEHFKQIFEGPFTRGACLLKGACRRRGVCLLEGACLQNGACLLRNSPTAKNALHGSLCKYTDFFAVEDVGEF